MDSESQDHPGFAVTAWYLTGYATAATPDGRHDWPPDPARLFMALVAAHYETGQEAGEREVLLQLERAGPPEIVASEADIRESPDPFVPGNGDNDRTDKSIQGLPVDHKRSQRPGLRRLRPRVPEGEEALVHFVWPRPEVAVDVEVLDRLCGKVTRLGHPMSLVHVWAAATSEETEPESWEQRLVPDSADGDVRRVPRPGALDTLDVQYAAKRRNEWLADAIRWEDQLVANAKCVKDGKVPALPKAYKNFLSTAPPIHRPTVSTTATYGPPPSEEQRVKTVFDPNPIILQLASRDSRFRRLSASAGPRVCDVLRRAMLDHAGDEAPAALTGHSEGGGRLEDTHVAYAPLPFVDHPHADGHLLGVAVVLPRNLGSDVEGVVQRCVEGIEQEGLKLGPLGVWKVGIEPIDMTTHALRPDTWTGGERGHKHWASVTPLAFDRHPQTKVNADPVNDPRRFCEQRLSLAAEQAEMIKAMCVDIGLTPEQVEVEDVDILGPVSRFIGAPYAGVRRRRAGSDGETADTQGYPRLGHKNGPGLRRQVHVRITFDKPIVGPVLLGAGRYRGWGLCRPLRERSH